MGNRDFSDDDSLIISAIRNPTKAVQLAGESFRRNIKEIADKQFPLPFEPSQIDLANRKINWRPGQKEKLANDSVSFAAGNNPAMVLSALKHLPETEFSKAHALAQKNAALPIEQGGLGLHPDNTAMERARALGFDTDVYHGTNADISKFDPKKSSQGGITWVADSPQFTEEFIRSTGGGNILPLKARMGKSAGWKEYDNLGIDELSGRGYESTWLPDSTGNSGFVMNPNQLRSRFAAFDPLKKNSANILAGAALGSTLLEKDKKRKDK